MNKIFKKGVTLIELVIVIIILILLAVIAIWNTDKSMQEAEAATIISEFKAVYQAVTMIKDNYNAGYDLVQNHDYCETITDDDGETWYVIYGLQDDDKYDEQLVTKYLGLTELKRSYEYKINENGSYSSDVDVRYYNGRSALVSGFRVKTYEDIRNVRGEITK
jgi:Tfp pilus assembly protein FimT